MANMSGQSLPEINQAGLRVMGAKGTWVIFMNFLQSWDAGFATNRLEVRKAMALAIDRKALAAAAYPGGSAEPVDFLVSPLQEGYDASLEPYPYDPEEARRLLKSVGLEGLDVTLFQYSFPGFGELPFVTQAVAGYLEAAGFSPHVTPRDFPAFVGDILGGTITGPANIGTYAWASSAALDSNLRILFLGHEDGGQISGFWGKAELSKLWDEYRTTFEEASRADVATRINHLIHESYGYIPIAIKNEIWAVGPKIGDWQPVAGAPLYPSFHTLRPAQ